MQDRPVDPARSRFVRGIAGGLASIAIGGRAPVARADPVRRMTTRPIPSTGEPLPVIGCGTYVGFDVAPDPASLARLGGVVRALFDAGGSVLDSSPMYGRAEEVTGRVLADDLSHDRAFVATKVWTSGRDAGIAQMEASLRLLGRRPLDLMQIHNLLDWRTHLVTLRRWKDEGRIRYVGVTHYTSSAYRELEAVLRTEPLDFVQVNYSIDEPDAADRILPLAAERRVAVLVNRPFGGGDLLRRLSAKPLPGWAAEIDATSWAQVLLKFVLSHPAVTCAIPGTGNAAHMADDARAGSGLVPDGRFWDAHRGFID